MNEYLTLSLRNNPLGNTGATTTSRALSWLIPAQPDQAAAYLVRHQVGKNTTTFENCDPTVQVNVEQVLDVTTGHVKAWRLRAIDEFGRNKTIGGDEFYVEFTLSLEQEDLENQESSSEQSSSNEGASSLRGDLSAWVHDMGDGTYELEFVTVPLITSVKKNALQALAVEQQRQNKQKSKQTADTEGNARGRLTVYFQYTCGIGSVPWGQKFRWKSGGSTRAVHHLDLTGTMVPPPFRDLVPPNQDGSIDLQQYDLVIAFGDSLIQRFVTHYPPITPIRNTYYKENIRSHLSVATLPTILEKLQLWHGDDLEEASNNSADAKLGESITAWRDSDSSNHTSDFRVQRRRVALFTGSSVWDITRGDGEGSDFAPHLQACRDYVLAIRQRYPLVDLYWRSPGAVHIHRALEACYTNVDCISTTKFASISRMYYLYQQQRKIMHELKVPWIDVYETFFLSADDTLAGDVRHFQDRIEAWTLTKFYPQFDYEAYLSEQEGSSEEHSSEGRELRDLEEMFALEREMMGVRPFISP